MEGAVNYEQLLQVAPRIKEAVGPERLSAADSALNPDPLSLPQSLGRGFLV